MANKAIPLKAKVFLDGQVHKFLNSGFKFVVYSTNKPHVILVIFLLASGVQFVWMVRDSRPRMGIRSRSIPLALPKRQQSPV